MYSVDTSEYTPDLVDDDRGLFPDETTTHDFQSAMFTLYSLPTRHCYQIPQGYRVIERFHSRDQYLCKFMRTKESVYI